MTREKGFFGCCWEVAKVGLTEGVLTGDVRSNGLSSRWTRIALASVSGGGSSLLPPSFSKMPSPGNFCPCFAASLVSWSLPICFSNDFFLALVSWRHLSSLASCSLVSMSSLTLRSTSDSFSSLSFAATLAESSAILSALSISFSSARTSSRTASTSASRPLLFSQAGNLGISLMTSMCSASTLRRSSSFPLSASALSARRRLSSLSLALAAGSSSSSVRLLLSAWHCAALASTAILSSTSAIWCLALSVLSATFLASASTSARRRTSQSFLVSSSCSWSWAARRDSCAEYSSDNAES